MPAYNQSARKALLLERGYEPRTTAWRFDIAAREYRGTLDARHHSDGITYQCIVPSSSLRFEPRSLSPVENQLLFGDLFVIYSVVPSIGWAWGKSLRDGHVGFVRAADFSPVLAKPTHYVSVAFTSVFPRPNRQSEPSTYLCLNARVKVYEIDRKDPIYARIGKNMWVYIGDLRKIGDWFTDPVTPLLGFVGSSPYVWGHNDGFGFDCSGATQAGYRAMGLDFCYRDADQQEADPRLGTDVSFRPDLSDLRPFDRVHYRNHLVLMVSSTTAIHAKGANTRRMVIEPILEINRWRIEEEKSGGITSVKRLEINAQFAQSLAA